MRIFYDGNCPLCCRKRDFLKQRDRNNKLLFSDIRDDRFQPEEIGVSFEELEKQIYALLKDGSIVKRMDVIREAYRELGMGWLIAPTGWPFFRPLFDALYLLVAKYRMTLSRLFK